MAKRKRNSDPPYNPKTYRRKNRKIQKKSQLHSQEQLLRLMGVSTPEALKMIVQGYYVDTPKKCKTEIIRSPFYEKVVSSTNNEILTTPSKKTQLGVSRYLETSLGKITIFLPQEKIKNERLDIPETPQNEINALEIPQALLEPIINKKVSVADVNRAAAEKQTAQQQGRPARYPSQKQVMKISARDAVQQATQLEVEDKLMHWVHFLSHSLLGNETQTPQNLGIATKNCNAEMELINPIINKMLLSKDHPDELYISIYPTWVENYKEIRLLDKLVLEIKNSPEENCDRYVKAQFDALTLKHICISEIEVIEQILLNVFNNNQAQPDEDVDDDIFLSTSVSSVPVITPLFETNKEQPSEFSSLPKPLIHPEAPTVPEIVEEKVLKPT